MTDRRLEIALERLNREFGQPIRGELSTEPPHDDELSSCPACGGQAIQLGTLGHWQHNRCRACGWTFSDHEEA